MSKLMPEGFDVRSLFKKYRVLFTNDFNLDIKGMDSGKYFFIVDKQVAILHRDRISKILEANNVFIVEATELNKTIGYCHDLIIKMVGRNIRKNDVLVAVGGGIIQDITAFISSIMFRGIDWIFYPTTLLAQADSCIGSKTSINLGKYKNLLGNFYPPLKVIINMQFLSTLSKDAIKSGIGEMLHFYIISNEPLIKRLMNDYEKILANPMHLKKYIWASLKIKKQMIEIDEFDKGARNIFNYGHTFGHAIESVSKYRVCHGQAVTMGMDIANYISLSLGYLGRKKYDSMRQILAKNMPEFSLTGNKINYYIQALSKDKKNTDQDLCCILTRGPGIMMKAKIPLNGRLKELILLYFNGR